MRYCSIKNVDINAGQGCRVSVTVCGRPLESGKEFTSEISAHVLDLLKPDNIRGISILGEPLHSQNIQDVLQLLSVITAWYPNKDVWLYTDLNWNEVCKLDYFEDLLYVVDVLVETKGYKRVIDVTATRLSGEVQEWTSYYD